MRLSIKKILPKEITVKERVYRIKFKKMEDFGICDDGRPPPGRMRKFGTITLRYDLKGKELISTFIHEVLHAIDFEYGAGIKHAAIYDLEKGLMELLEKNFLCPKSLILRSR